MAKSKKPVSKKKAKKAVKKAAKKAPKKTVKKVAKKAAKTAAKKAVRSMPATGKRFLIIYHAPIEAMEQTANVSPDQQAEGMAMWMAWAKKCGERLADLGAPLMNGKRLSSMGSLTPSTKEVSGYSLLDAADWNEVLDLMEDHPHISGWHPEATIEIHETMLLPGM